ncbi:hypothetical protein SYNPS1DRAFT_25896, partial [Syncephalis pseudoplumigaleata]
MSRCASELFHREQHSGEQRQDKDARLVDASETIASTAVVTDIVDFMTDEERALVMSKFGTWSEEDMERHRYGWEAMGILQWALGIVPDMPGYAEEFDRKQLLLATGIQATRPETLAQFIDHATSPSVQPPSNETMARAIAQADLWHWRASAQSMLELPQRIDAASVDAPAAMLKDLPAGVRDMMRYLPRAIASFAARAHASGILPEVVEDDFAVRCPPQRADGPTKAVAYRTLD